MLAVAIALLSTGTAPSESSLKGRSQEIPLPELPAASLYLQSKAIQLPHGSRELPTKLAELINTLTRQDKDTTLKVWIFFTDKGPEAEKALSGDIASFPTLKRSHQRRSKVGLDKIVFADLPVHSAYVRQLERIDGKLVGQSRWLNAAVFEFAPGQIATLSALPFIFEIRPHLTLRRPATEIQEPEIVKPAQRAPGQNPSLNYGISAAQLSQIGADSGHALGHTGAGVTLAMLDTGYRKSHAAFSMAYSEGRVLAEWDFINNDGNTANEGADNAGQWRHGTLTWSTAGGQYSGQLYGPAYQANFLLAKTENVTSETIQEEYDWVAALEWADSLGADVLSSSLAYSDWYVYANYNGAFAVTTKAANMAAGLGIVVCNAMGNTGPASGTLAAPADAFDILSCGSVDVSGTISSFSSRGPTADGRIKPEVCARGTSTYCAGSNDDFNFVYASGTSLSTPLVAGVAAQLISARPTLSPLLIMRALKETASQAATPDNAYGWGIINFPAALYWGANFTANSSDSSRLVVDFPSTIQFADNSDLTANSWDWDFGDGQTSTLANPSHSYAAPGVYDVTLTIGTNVGVLTRQRTALVVVRDETISLVADSAYAGETLVISVELSNAQPISSLHIPLSYQTVLNLTFDSLSVASRLKALSPFTSVSDNTATKRLEISSSISGTALAAGDGEVYRLYFTIDRLELGGISGALDTISINEPLSVSVPVSPGEVSFPPHFLSAGFRTKSVVRGDANNNQTVNIADVFAIVYYLYNQGPAPRTVQSGDADGDLGIDLADALYLINTIFLGGPLPPSP